jgi:thiamine biosynthesis protein ThiS
MIPESRVSTDHKASHIIASLNGERREFGTGLMVQALIESLGIKPDRVAVEFDRKIIKPEEWARTEIREGSEIEIVHFVGGG